MRMAEDGGRFVGPPGIDFTRISISLRHVAWTANRAELGPGNPKGDPLRPLLRLHHSACGLERLSTQAGMPTAQIP